MSTPPRPVKNCFHGGRMAPFDYSLSNASTGVDKRAPAGRCTFEASCPNRSGLDEILALKYHPMMNPKGIPVVTRSRLFDSYEVTAWIPPSRITGRQNNRPIPNIAVNLRSFMYSGSIRESENRDRNESRMVHRFTPRLENHHPPNASPKKLPTSRAHTGIWLPLIVHDRSNF